MTDSRVGLKQVHSYLYQLSERLNEALSLVDVTVEATAANAEKALHALSSAMQSESASLSKEAKESLINEANQLKALIQANADEIVHTEEKITQELEETYVAKSEFGTFKEQNKTTIEETARGEVRNFVNSQTFTDLDTKLGNLEGYTANVESYIRTGLLFYDSNGLPVHGVAVGDKIRTITDGQGHTVLDSSCLSATFTPDRLSFYQFGNEIAYLSNHQLYITNAVIQQKLTLGRMVLTVDTQGVLVSWAKGS